MIKESRNGNIELLRFIFAIGILVYHCSSVYERIPFQSGYLGVEFFFMVTGIFLGKKISRIGQVDESLFETFSQSGIYILEKMKKIMYFLVPYTLAGWRVNTYFSNGAKDIISPKSIFLITEFGFLRSFGFTEAHATWVAWYLSAMFIALWFIYPILRRYYKCYAGYFAPFIALFSFGILFKNFGTININGDLIACLFNSGVIRAIASISFGVFLNYIAEKVSLYEFKKSFRIIVTAFEIVLYALIFFYMSYSNGYYDIMVVILIAGALFLTISQQSLFYGKFDNKISAFLGKFSMVLFLNHNYWAQNMESISQKISIMNGFTWWQKTIGVIVLSFVSSVFVYFIGNKFSKLALKINIKKLLVKD